MASPDRQRQETSGGGLTARLVGRTGATGRVAKRPPSKILPIRCPCCNRVLGRYQHRWPSLCARMSPAQALARLNINRICCRTIMLTAVDTCTMMLDYERANRLRPPHDTAHQYVTVHDAASALQTRRLDALCQRQLRLPEQKDPKGNGAGARADGTPTHGGGSGGGSIHPNGGEGGVDGDRVDDDDGLPWTWEAPPCPSASNVSLSTTSDMAIPAAGSSRQRQGDAESAPSSAAPRPPAILAR